MEKFLNCILIGCLIAFVIISIAVIIMYVINRNKKEITWKGVDKKKLVTEALPAIIAVGCFCGTLIWCWVENVSTFTLIVLIGLPGALIACLK